MLLENKRIVLGITSAFYAIEKTIPQIEKMIAEGADIIPVMSFYCYNNSQKFIKKIENITGKQIIHTIKEAEIIGHKIPTDIMAIIPCTGNTIGKLTNGIIDTPILVAAKTNLKSENNIVIGIATNDGLSIQAENIGKLLKQKNNGEIKITFSEISNQTGYSRMHLNRLIKEVEKKDIDNLLVHGLTGKNSNNSAPSQEIEYIKNFKNQYPVISISQFMDIYHEDVIWNKEKQDDVKKYNLKVRSKSFFQQLYKKEGWKSPVKHKSFKNDSNQHPLRDPSPRRGILIMTDGTPHDWFGNGKLFSLHMTLDDATDEILSGWFMPTECQLGYCYAFKIMFEKYGLPQSIYSDRTTILWNQKDGELTQVGRMLDELGIELIYANTPQAKGKIENKNKVVQNRLLNDIKRFNIKTYDELNKWFNDYYIDYLNKKFSYPPLEEETDFIPLDNTDLSTIMCIKVDRKILNGNMISINNNYYIPINSDGSDFVFYKGTTVEVWQDVFTNDIRIFKNNKIYNTRKIEGHRVDMKKKEQKIIDDQKQLEVLLRERDERLKARAKHS